MVTLVWPFGEPFKTAIFIIVTYNSKFKLWKLLSQEKYHDKKISGGLIYSERVNYLFSFRPLYIKVLKRNENVNEKLVK
jgi:hypothetical protein